MAKHIVKCAICNQSFDTNSIQAVKHGARRYSHATCEPDNTDYVEMEISKKSLEDSDLAALKDYINKTYKSKANWTLITKQIKDFKKNKGYTYSSMLKTLIYFYDIKKNSVDKSNGGIGIIDYVYNDAKQYYYNIWLAQQINKEQIKDNSITHKIKEYVIKIPNKRGTKNKLINFEMGDNNEE